MVGNCIGIGFCFVLLYKPKIKTSKKIVLLCWDLVEGSWHSKELFTLSWMKRREDTNAFQLPPLEWERVIDFQWWRLLGQTDDYYNNGKFARFVLKVLQGKASCQRKTIPLSVYIIYILPQYKMDCWFWNSYLKICSWLQMLKF